MGADLDELMRKTKTYWYEDGLVEILGGLFFVAVGAWLLLERAAPPNARQDIVRVIPLVIGAGVAALLARIGGELALARFYIEAVWSLAAGLFLAWLTAELALGIALYYVLLGAAVLLAGVVTLLRYLRAAPPEVSHDG